MEKLAEFRRFGAAIVVAALFGGQALADDSEPDCVNRGTTMDLQLCTDRDAREADKELNAVYRRLSAGLDAHGKELLTGAQRAWTAFRDKECAYRSIEGEGGSGHSVMYLECLMQMTKARTAELKASQNQ